MPRRFSRWMLFCLVALLPGWAGAQPAVLDEDCSFRRYYRFGVNRYDPAQLKAEGQKILGKQRWARLRRKTERWLQSKGRNPRQVDWRDHVYHVLLGAREFTPTPAPPPPSDWAGTEFDDAAWVRHRGFFQGGPDARIANTGLGQFRGSVDMRLQQAFYRARFVVDDPAKATDLTVGLTYSGGVRVLINGAEVARGHLPDGPLDPEAPAEGYPAKAYTLAGAGLRHRRLTGVRIVPRLLRKGVNVLAVELRAARFHPVVLANPIQPNWGGPQRPWPHAKLTKLALRTRSPAVRSAAKRPPGVQVWVADMHHRVDSDEFLPPGEPRGKIRIVALRNSTHAAQIVVGTDKPLRGLKVEAEVLDLPGISARVSYMAPFPADEWTLTTLGDERGLEASFPSNAQLTGHAASPARRCIFDRLTPTAPAGVPAGTCQPIWLSVRTLRTGAGRRHGKVRVTADAMDPVELPVELEIFDWPMTDPKDWQSFVGCEQNPYGVAAQYRAKLWSDEHFKLIEASFLQLGRIGNDWVNVPVLAHSEFGNRTDGIIRWIRRRDGKLGFDYSRLDRYLNLAVTHCGRPRVIQFTVMHGMKGRSPDPKPPEVPVVHEVTGRTSLMRLAGPAGREAWRAFARSLHAHMKARGLHTAMYWGYPWESEADPSLKGLLAAVAPGVYWIAGPHEMMANGVYAKDQKFYKLVADIRYHGGWPAFRDDMGWKSKTLHLLNPRVGGTCFALHTTSLPLAYRMLPDRALAMGRTGFTRVGADEWAGIHYQGMTIPRWLTGVPVLFMLWPGKSGAESSARFEALLEGVQEAEVRIRLEKALDAGRLPGGPAARVRSVLKRHFRETDFVQGNSIVHDIERYHYGWQERSRRLFQLAADVARQVKSSGR